MRDLAEMFSELDLLETPDLRSEVDARIATRPSTVGELAMPLVNTSRWRGPLIAVATAVLIVVAVGVIPLLLASRNTPTTEEPVTPPPTTEVTVTTSATESTETTTTPEPIVPAPDDPIEDGVSATSEWRKVVESEPWVERIVDVEPLPGGGYVAVASEPSPWSVIWSPDGIAWLDGDPGGLVPTQTKRVAALSGTETIDRHPNGNHLIAAVEGRVVVVDQLNAGVLVGDPQTGEWSHVGLDTSGLDGVLVPLAIADNDRQVLVVHAVDNGSVAELVFWLVDPATSAIAGPFASRIEMGPWTPQVGWVDDRWIVMIHAWQAERGDKRNTLWVSPDAEAWTEMALPGEVDTTWDDGPPGLASFGGLLVTAPTGAIVQRAWMGGGDTWYSPDGIEWQQVREGFSEGVAHSDTYGFLISPGGAGLLASNDGVTWQRLGGTRTWFEALLAASERTVLQLSDSLSGLWLWSEDPLPPTPTTTYPSAGAAPTPTLPWVSGPHLEASDDEVMAFIEGFASDWADAWISGDAERISNMLSDDAMYANTGDGLEHHGRTEIESALAAHFETATYTTFELTGFEVRPLIDTDSGPVLDTRLYWEWGGTLDGDPFYAVETSTKFHINYDDGTTLGFIHSDWE